MYTLMDFIRETIFRPLAGAAPSNLFHALEIDQVLLAHTLTGTGVPPKIVKIKNLA